MKKIVLSIVLLLLCILTIAQSPESFSYQVIVRDGGNVVSEHLVSFQFSIIKGVALTNVIYTEKHSVITNQFGLVNLAIGNGTDKTGNFTTIDWGADDYFLKVEIDVTGVGTVYTDMGTTQLLSVPYAMHAKTAESVTGTISETQTLADVAAINNSVNAQLKNVTDPTDAQDATTKVYVDALMQEIDFLKIVAGVGSLTDFDGNVYRTIRIGIQIWMAENLKVTHYSDGTSIPLVTGNNNWDLLFPWDKAYCWYNDDINNKSTYGALYSWAAAMNGVASSSANPSGVQGVCPTGWHLPSNAEWTVLTNYLGGESVAGGKLKETELTHWASPNLDATNTVGFTSLPGGIRNDIVGYFSYIGNVGYWWSATEQNSASVFMCGMSYNSGAAYITSYLYKTNGISVRCLRD